MIRAVSTLQKSGGLEKNFQYTYIGSRKDNWYIIAMPPKYMSQLFFQADYSTYYLLSFLSVDEFPQFIYIFFFTALRHTLTLELLPGKSVNWGTIFAFISTHFM